MSKFDRKELSPRICWILKTIESYTEERHTQGSRFINANTQQKWELLEDILTEQVQEVQAEPVAKVLGWVRKKNGEIGSHFFTYEPHCDCSVRDNGGEKIAVIAATAPQPADSF